MRELERRQNVSFRNEFRFAFNHQNAVAGTRNHDVQVGFFHFLGARVGNHLSIDSTDLYCGCRTIERNIADLERRRSTDATPKLRSGNVRRSSESL